MNLQGVKRERTEERDFVGVRLKRTSSVREDGKQRGEYEVMEEKRMNGGI